MKTQNYIEGLSVVKERGKDNRVEPHFFWVEDCYLEQLPQYTIIDEDFIDTEDENDIEKMVEHEDLKRIVWIFLDRLNDREAKVLKLRFGLEEGQARTLEEVGKEFNVTRDRIRQIESKALMRIKKMNDTEYYLKDFIYKYGRKK